MRLAQGITGNLSDEYSEVIAGFEVMLVSTLPALQLIYDTAPIGLACRRWTADTC